MKKHDVRTQQWKIKFDFTYETYIKQIEKKDLEMCGSGYPHIMYPVTVNMYIVTWMYNLVDSLCYLIGKVKIW